MSIILNIDTATENAQVSIAKDGIILQHLDNDHQKKIMLNFCNLLYKKFY